MTERTNAQQYYDQKGPHTEVEQQEQLTSEYQVLATN
jgi:hypothetical protein